jgi:hypothetical protein
MAHEGCGQGTHDIILWVLLPCLHKYRFPAGRYTIPVNYVGYSIFILVFEVVGSSNTVLQGLYLLRRKEYHYGSFLQHPVAENLDCCAPAAGLPAHILPRPIQCTTTY